MKNFRALMGMMLATAAVVNVGAMAASENSGHGPLPRAEYDHAFGRPRIGDGYGRQRKYTGHAMAREQSAERKAASDARQWQRTLKRLENDAKREAGIVAARVALGCAS